MFRPSREGCSPLSISELGRRLNGVAGCAPSTVGGREIGSDAVVAVAMSGGVDSSVAAALAVASGAQVLGFTMRLWATEAAEDAEGGCCSVDAVEDARRVCSALGIPHYVLNMAEVFHQGVVSDFLEQYSSGRTPNPCIRCNETIKFGEWVRRVSEIGATHVATGHYARISSEPLALYRAVDERKDQSYTLYRCSPEVLQRLLLPLGQMAKEEVRRLASALGLGVAAKPDSQDLCFVGGGDHRELLGTELGGKYAPGPIVDLEGRRLGEHRGLPFYTIGQRQGLRLEVERPDSGPRYVVGIDQPGNSLVVGPWQALLRRHCRLDRCTYLGAPAGELRGDVQVRAHGRPAAARWKVEDGTRATVIFDHPQIAVAPGQSLVLYDGDRVVAGGEAAA